MKIKKINLENIVIIIIGLSFFMGIWHAFPMLNVVNDEMYFVGGVLRAIENHTIIPAPNDVPYGTLTYLINYPISIIVLTILLPFFVFNIANLKLFLVQDPWVMYLSLRILSAFFSIIILYYVNKFLKKIIENLKTRLFLLILTFSNIITLLILHTGKVWVLSILLVIVSFYYLNETLKHTNSNSFLFQKDLFLSLSFSFLAFANFPLNFFCLINIPILVYTYRKDKNILISIAKYVVIGFLIYIIVTLINYDSIKNQIISIFTEYHPIVNNTNNISIIQSFYLYILKLLLLFPLTIFTLFLVFKNKIKHKKIFIVSSIYFITYFFTIVLIANWSTDTKTYLRYLFPLGFFLVFMISSFNLKLNRIFYSIGFISIFYGVITLYYLSMPSTYNLAYRWIGDNLSGQNITIINTVDELQLIKNKNSAMVIKNELCATKCKNIIKFDLNKKFLPLVLDNDTDYSSKDTMQINGKTIYISDKVLSPISYSNILASFVNKSSDYHSVDYNMGSYFDFSLLRIRNLGKNIYVYEI
jgi:hypothetical protein